MEVGFFSLFTHNTKLLNVKEVGKFTIFGEPVISLLARSIGDVKYMKLKSSNSLSINICNLQTKCRFVHKILMTIFFSVGCPKEHFQFSKGDGDFFSCSCPSGAFRMPDVMSTLTCTTVNIIKGYVNVNSHTLSFKTCEG